MAPDVAGGNLDPPVGRGCAFIVEGLIVVPVEVALTWQLLMKSSVFFVILFVCFAGTSC